jgi:antitoxin ParD1/3/4
MQVALTPALDRLVQRKVSSGLYDNASEVIREALRLMADRESGLEWLRSEATLGFEQLEAGEFLEVTREEFLQQMHQRHVP